jgi:hypothetical protein
MISLLNLASLGVLGIFIYFTLQIAIAFKKKDHDKKVNCLKNMAIAGFAYTIFKVILFSI